MADITSPVTYRVGLAWTCELKALCGNCGLVTKLEGAVPLDSCVEANACTETETETETRCKTFRGSEQKVDKGGSGLTRTR